MTDSKDKLKKIENSIEKFVFFSRWFQAPLYIGLIIGGILYAWKFGLELIHLVHEVGLMNESSLMLGILTLVDIVMISQLLTMVIIGGWYTFVSKIDISHEDYKPEWLDSVNAGVLKVKMATSLVGVSGIHLLQTFINIQNKEDRIILWQTIIHVTFLLSALALSYIEKLTHKE